MMLETNKNYFADNRDILKTIPNKSINMFLEDMPYNTTACDWEYEVDLKEYWELRLPKLADNGVFVLTASQPFTTDLIISNRKMFKYELIWDKQTSGSFILAKFKPLKIHEDILIFANNKINYYPQMQFRLHENKRGYRKEHETSQSIKIASGVSRQSDNWNEDLKYPQSIIQISNQSKECNQLSRLHPTQKPIELFSYLIKTYTNENDIVFDGYSGSGTTAIACIRNNRQYIICENKKEYFDLQTKRIQEEIDKTSLFNSLGGRQDRISA